MSRATGTYKGRILEHALSETRRGLPQFIVRLFATEIYDEAEKEWIGIEAHDGEAEIAYLVLCTPTQEIFHVANLREALDWTGGTFESLAKGDWVGVDVQYRVEENDYNGSVTQKVVWVRGADAPVGNCRPASAEAVKVMDQKFGGFLKNSATGTKNVTPPVPSKPKPAASTKKTTKKSTKAAPASAPPIPQEQSATPPVEQTEDPAKDDAPPVSKANFFERQVATEEETWNLVCEAGELSEESEKNIEQYWFDGKKMYGDEWNKVKQYVLEQMIPF